MDSKVSFGMSCETSMSSLQIGSGSSSSAKGTMRTPSGTGSGSTVAGSTAETLDEPTSR